MHTEGRDGRVNLSVETFKDMLLDMLLIELGDWDGDKRRLDPVGVTSPLF